MVHLYIDIYKYKSITKYLIYFNTFLYKPSKGFEHFLFDGNNIFLQGDNLFLDSSVEFFESSFGFLQIAYSIDKIH